MTFLWEDLPEEISNLILIYLGKSLLGYMGPPGRLTNLSNPKDGHAYVLEVACVKKSFATSLQPILDLYSPPWDDGHAKRFVGGLLKFMLGRHVVWTNGTITADNYAFLYTRLYDGCGFKKGVYLCSHRANYYRLLPRMLTDLLRARMLPWKGLEAVQKQIRALSHIAKPVDHLIKSFESLDPLQVCLERAYLEGNPDKTTDPVYYDPIPKDKKGRVYSWKTLRRMM